MELQSLCFTSGSEMCLALGPALQEGRGGCWCFRGCGGKDFQPWLPFPALSSALPTGCRTPRCFLHLKPRVSPCCSAGHCHWTCQQQGGTERNIKTKQCKAPERSGICHLTPFMWKAIAKHPVDNLLFRASTSCCWKHCWFYFQFYYYLTLLWF